MVIVLASFWTVRAVRADLSTPVVEYGSDTWTLLFENYEGVTQADATSGIAFQAGYLGGQALYLADTTSFAEYADTWWALTPDNFQESGTIECYFRPETFVNTSTRSYGMILGRDEHPITPGVPGMPQLSVFGDGLPSWKISQGAGGYLEAVRNSDEPPLYPGQWYHLAATWGNSTMKIFVNNREVATYVTDTDAKIKKGVFQVGARGTVGGARGLAARGWIDRLRISGRPRTAGEYPRPLDVRIDSPISDVIVTLTRPFPIQYRAYGSDTRARTVALYADSDNLGFDGVLLAQGLKESGVVLVGAATGLIDGQQYYLYTVARSSAETAYFYTPSQMNLLQPAGTASLVALTDTTGAVAVTASDTGESFTVVLLQGGGTTSAPLASRATATGASANYAVQSPLLTVDDSTVVYLWTSEATAGLYMGLRSDTANLRGPLLPAGIPNTDAGRRAFGATVMLVEFMGANGRMIGDTKTTSYVGDSFAYTIEYRFSAATAGAYRNLDFDTAPGSTAFRFYFADTYGAGWTEDTTCTVTVLAGSSGGLIVRVAGLTRDLPGGLGGIGPQSILITQPGSKGLCLLTASGCPDWLLDIVRSLRDTMHSCAASRWWIQQYYEWGRWLMEYWA